MKLKLILQGYSIICLELIAHQLCPRNTTFLLADNPKKEVPPGKIRQEVSVEKGGPFTHLDQVLQKAVENCVYCCCCCCCLSWTLINQTRQSLRQWGHLWCSTSVFTFKELMYQDFSHSNYWYMDKGKTHITCFVVLQLRLGRAGDRPSENWQWGGEAYCCGVMSEFSQQSGGTGPASTDRVSDSWYFLFFI